jgi:hypothetical protein
VSTRVSSVPWAAMAAIVLEELKSFGVIWFQLMRFGMRWLRTEAVLIAGFGAVTPNPCDPATETRHSNQVSAGPTIGRREGWREGSQGRRSRKRSDVIIFHCVPQERHPQPNIT